MWKCFNFSGISLECVKKKEISVPIIRALAEIRNWHLSEYKSELLLHEPASSGLKNELL